MINTFEGMTSSTQFFGFSLVLFSLTICGQSFDRNIVPAKMKLPNEQIQGFSTPFDFSQDQIRLAWWKYAKKFSLPKNLRTHYKVTIPATKNLRSLVIFTQSLGETKSTTFKLAIKTSDMSQDEKKKYSKQAKVMLLNFKRWYYLRHYEEQLKKMEKNLPSIRSMKWTFWMGFVAKREKILEKVREI